MRDKPDLYGNFSARKGPFKLLSRTLLGEDHPHQYAPPFLTDVETHRYIVVVVEPYSQLAHRVGQLHFEMYCNFVHPLARAPAGLPLMHKRLSVSVRSPLKRALPAAAWPRSSAALAARLAGRMRL